MNKLGLLTRIVKNNLPIIILALIAIFISFKNYTPGTILSGWDTLHPEFNFGLALEREIFGVFRSYQGLGAVSAHSAMADLPRIMLLMLFDVFLPMNFLRYSYMFLALILGPIGMYLFLYKHVLKEKASSFLGGLFYLLNLGTLQQFVVPFEMFVTQYATLPWLFLFATDFLSSSNHSKKTLLLFALATILAAPQAYAATLWYIYFIAFVLYLSFLSLPSVFRHSGLPRISLNGWRFWMRGYRLVPPYQNDGIPKENLAKRAFILIIITLLLNSFWILPNIYYVVNHASEVPNANINKLFSEQAFLYNKEFGNIKDIAILKSFFFDWNVYAGNNHFTQLLSPWSNHLKQFPMEILAYSFALIALIGIIYSIRKRNVVLIALLPVLILCLFFLFNDNPPTSPLFSFLQERFSFFKEAYRFPQDKVRGAYTFLFAIYFAAGQYGLTMFLRTVFNRSTMKQFNNLTMNESSRQVRTISKTGLIQVTVFSLLIFYFMLPAFKGELISPYMRTKIPNFYFEMFKWFDEREDDARVANLPIHSFWGWDYYKWGFQGAGFIWFGIKQPMLARDFDRWIPYNEQYYREMSYAIYSQNQQDLMSTIEKYKIKYILLDKSIIAPPNPHKILLYEETEDLLDGQDYIQKVKEFGNTLVVYEVKSKAPNGHYVIQNPFSVYEQSKVFYEDFIYKEYGNYIVSQNGVYYPFRAITDNQNKILPNILQLTQEGVTVKLPKEVNQQTVIFPSYLDIEESLPSDLLVEKKQNQLNIKFYPRLPVSGSKASPIPPIILKSPLPQSENIILSINKKDNFILNTSLSDIPLSLGTVFLATNNDNTVSIYSVAPNEEIIPDLKSTNHYIEPCEPSTYFVLDEDLGNQKIFGTEEFSSNSFYILGKNVPLCLTLPLANLLPKTLNTSDVLLNVKFDYSSNLPLNLCIVKIDNGSCQAYRNNNLFQYFVIDPNELNNLGLQFRLDTSQSQEIEKAIYENLSLSLTYPFFSTAFSTLSNPSSPSNSSTLLVPFSGNQQLSAKITEFPKTNGNCPNQPNSNQPIVKKEILKENNDEFIRYVSEKGTACDHFSYQTLAQNEAYLLAITSRNVKGLPLTICVANQVSKHCDIYASVSRSGNFTTDVFLLPPGIKNQSGFDVNIRNLGIKKTPAVNDLKSIEIIPFPYKWLSQINTPHPRPLPQGERGRVRGVLVLPQSFEKGWKAYRIMNYELGIMNWINNNFPFIFGKELESHVLVNNWANGWTIDNSDLITHNSEFRIIFLPQYLEYFGFVLVGGAIIYLFKLKNSSS